MYHANDKKDLRFVHGNDTVNVMVQRWLTKYADFNLSNEKRLGSYKSII